MTLSTTQLVLILLFFSIAPFTGIFLHSFVTEISDNPDCLHNDVDKRGLVTYLFDSLLAMEFRGSGGNIFSGRRVAQLGAVLIHCSNSLLLYTFIDEYLMFQRRYGLQIRSSCSAVMTVLFAAHSMRIAVLKDSTMTSLTLLLSVTFALIGLIYGLNFLTAYNNNETSVRTLVLFLVSSSCLTVSAIAHASSTLIPVIAVIGILMRKLRLQQRGMNWVDRAILVVSVLCCSMIYLSSLRIRSVQSNRDAQQILNSLTALPPPPSAITTVFLELYQASSNVVKSQLGVSANFDPDYTIDALEALRPMQQSTKNSVGGGKKLFVLLDLIVVLSLVLSLLLKGLWDGVRWGSMSNLTFSCLAYVSLLTVACAPSSLGSGGDLLHFDTLAISMQSYVPSCFLSFCLGEKVDITVNMYCVLCFC